MKFDLFLQSEGQKSVPPNMELSTAPQPPVMEVHPTEPTLVYSQSPGELNFVTLQENLQTCLDIVDDEVMKNYVPDLQNCEVVQLSDEFTQTLEQIQFFRISRLVYHEDEFSVHKLSTVFNALSNKPCTLVLMIQSDGQNNDFYLGIRSRDSNYSTGTMRQLLEQSLLGLFPGSSTDEYLDEDLKKDMDGLCIGCVSSVTCVADYKQDKHSVGNKDFIQGLEKFIYSMQGKRFTAICIANNLDHDDLVETRKDYERIYTLMSPFASMQYNYALNSGSSISSSDTEGTAETDTTGRQMGVNINKNESQSESEGQNLTYTATDTKGSSVSVGTGKTHTIGTTDGVNDSTTVTKTVSTSINLQKNVGINLGCLSAGSSINADVSSSVVRGKTHGTSHTDSVSDSISQNLTQGMSSSRSTGQSVSCTQNKIKTSGSGIGFQHSKSEGHSTSTSFARTKTLTDTFGNSQAVTLNVQNKSLVDMLQRLEKQLERLDECESIGMWDFAAYFLGESAAETETAASMYRSLVSGNQSGLESAAVNTWKDDVRVKEIAKYVTNFQHPVFLYQSKQSPSLRPAIVDATVLVSTNELAIQLGLPRKSVKGLSVIEHAMFAQEVLKHSNSEAGETIALGTIHHLGRDMETNVNLDLQSLSMHTFITGSTGAGKSNTAYQILSQLLEHQIHFLVVEPAKGEYKNVFGDRPDVLVFGTNPLLTDLLRINPFSFPQGIHIYEHLDRLVEIFNVCWPMYAAMPAILKDAIERSYVKAGWDLRKSENKYSNYLFPNFIDVLHEINEVMEQSQYSSDNKGDYRGALCTRLRSLTNGINRLVFTSDELSSQELFEQNVIIDLSRVGSSETKSLIMGLLVMKLQEYRMASCTGMNVPLAHITVLEEAHNLLRKTSTEQSAEGANLLGKAVEMLANAIAEMRTYGEGFIIADQSPGLLDMSVIRNTNTKIIMRLPEQMDRELVGRAAGLKEEQIAELSKLNKGVAAVYQNDWLEAVLCKVRNYQYEERVYSKRANGEELVRDLKGDIISKLIAKDIFHLIDCVDDKVLNANMPAPAKCRLFDYVKAPSSKRLDAAAAAAYELFSAEVAFRALEKNSYDYGQQVRFLEERLTPSIAPLPESSRQVLLSLITYWNMRVTENPTVKILLKNLIDSERKGELVQ